MCFSSLSDCIFIIWADARQSVVADTTTQFIQKVGIIISAVSQQHCTAMLQFYVQHSKSLYLLTPWSIALPEKLTGSQLVTKFPAYYGTRRFITTFARTLHLSPSWTRSIQSMLPHRTSWKIQLNIILPSTPGTSKWLRFLRFPHQNPVCTSPLHHTCYVPRPPHSSRFDHPSNIWWGV